MADYSREQIVDLAMQMLGAGATLDDVISAASNYGVDLASVYYSDPGTSFSASTPADTGSVDTGPVNTGPVDTGPIYSEPDNSGFEDFIVDPRSGSSGSVPVQSPLSTVSSGPVETGPVNTGPVSSGSVPVQSPLSTVSSGSVDNRPVYTQEQYQDAGQFIAQNLDKPEVIAKVAQDLGLSTQDILAAAQTVNTGVTTGDVENYLSKATSPVDTGPVVTSGALPTVSSTDTSAAVTGPLESMASGNALGASSTSSQGGALPVDTAGSTGASPLDTVSPAVTDPLYDPKLKANWGVESVGDFGLQNDPRFHGQGSQFYIDPVTGKYLTEQEYLSTANTPEALKYQADQAEKERLQGIYTSVGNQVRSFIDPNSSGGSWTKESGLDSGPGFGVQGMLDQLGQRIVEKTGVTDLNNLQLKYVDKPVTETIYAFAGDDGTQYRRLVPDPATGESTYQALTPDEISRLRTERDVDGNTTTLLDSTVKQGQVYDKSTGKLVSDSESINLGDWGQGPGITYGSINFDENGKPIVSTSGEDTTAGIVKAAAQLGPVVTIANVLSGGALTPLQLAVNAVSAVDAANRGNILPLIATAAGAGGYTGIIDPSLASNIQTGVSAIGALDKGNVLGALATVAGSGLGSEVGSIDLGGGLKVTDALNAVSAVDSLVKGDIAGALTLAGKAAGSDELQTAGTALKVINAIESGNLNAAVSAGTQLYNNVNQLVDKSQVASLLANSAGIGAIDADLGADLGGLKASTVAGALGNDTVTGALNNDTVTGTLGNDAVTGIIKPKSTTSRDTQYDPDLTDATKGQALATQIANAQEAIRMGAGESVGTGEITAGAGEFTGADRAALINDRIQGATSFADAYAIARQEFGPNATFNYGGKLYSTATAAERPDLSSATTTTASTAVTDTPYVAPNGMHNRAAFIAAGGGTSDADYAKYVQAVNAVIAEGKSGTLITPASVNSTGKELPPTTGPVTMEKPRVDSVLGSVAAQGVASFGANSIAGGLSALGFTDAGAAVLNKANQIAAAATAAEGADITKGKADINAAIQKVGQSSDIKDFAANIGNLASTAFNNPKAFGATVGSEVVEELLQLATVKFPGSFLVKETVASAIENGGAAYNTEYESQIAKGASKEDAHQAAQKAAGTAAAITVGLAGGAAAVSKVAGKVLGSQADEVPTSGVGQVGKTTLKESAQETVEEGSIAAGIDLALGRPVDAINMLTNMTGGALYGGPTSGVMQGTKLDTLDQAASTSIGTGINNQLSTELAAGTNPVTAISSAVNSGITTTGANSTTVLNGVVSSGLSNGVDPATVVSSTLTGALNNNVNLDTALSTVVGSAISNNVNPSTVVTSAIDSTLNNSNVNSLAAATMASNAAINSSLGVTGSATTAVTNVVAGTLNSNLATAVGANGATTLAVNAGVSTAISNSVNPSTAISGAVASAVNNGSNPSTAVATAVATALASGVDTTTAVNSALNANNNTGLTVDTNSTTNLSTAVVTDTKNNTVTQVTNNSDSGITTSVVTNNNTGSTVTTSINNNSGIVTTTTVDGNIKTDVVVDTTTNTTTTVATDVKTGQVINTDTVVGGQGNDVITQPPIVTKPPVVTQPPPVVTEPPVITEPPPVITQSPVTVTPQTKTTTPQPKTSGALSSLLMGGGTGLGALPGNLSPSMLEGAPIEALMNLPQLVQLYPQLANVDPRLLQMLSGRAGAQASSGMGDAGNLPTALSMTQAGAEPSPGMPVKAAKAATTNQDTKLLGGAGPLSGKLDALSAAGLTALNTGLGYAKGGLSHASGHNPEFITGATGYYVKGRGDGQSDDIPAMLADGEYVFDADTVAALGNGSSDAGAKILDKMRENIRKHKRSAHHSKIPPKAKSPLEYLKG